jgi:hypothetical protein
VNAKKAKALRRDAHALSIGMPNEKYVRGANERHIYTGIRLLETCYKGVYRELKCGFKKDTYVPSAQRNS